MPAPTNLLKQKLLRREFTTGCWVTLANAGVAEALAHCGFDWLLIDAEHGPNDIQNVFAQLQAIDAARANGATAKAIVRVSSNNEELVKRVMDCGAQTVMFPSIETAEEAAHAVASTRYPQDSNGGMRGVYGNVRAGNYGLDQTYMETANAQACVIIQIESAKGFANAEAIAATEGVDCIFIGPADFAASLGHLGNTTHAEVQTAIDYITAVCLHHGKAIGNYARDTESAKRNRDMGMNLVALDADVVWMTRAASEALAEMKNTAAGTTKKRN
jgi:2-dehydro-3-deoxyglucarate aldolase